MSLGSSFISMNLAIIAITRQGAQLGARLREELGTADLFVPAKHAPEAGPRAIGFTVELKELLRRLWPDHDGFCFIMAAGIVVRMIAPHLKGKEKDPAVVVMDEMGKFAISLLSGHLGGANDLAGRLARISGGEPVITTATDVNGLLAWDEAARRAGLTPEPISHIRRLNSLLLAGRRIALVDRQGRIAPWFAETPGVVPAANFAEAHGVGEAMVFVTHRFIPHLERQENLLVLRPRDLVVGVGCNRGASAEEIEAAVRGELQRAFLAFASVAVLATIDEKADEAGLLAFASRHGLSVDFHPAAALNAVPVPSGPSVHALAAVGARGVCEPAALLSAGGGALLVTKKKVGNVTVAVAERP